MSESKTYLEIDLNKLEEEWVEHVNRYHKAAVRLADAHADLAEEKVCSEITEAEVDREVRDNPSKYGIDRVTDTAIKSVVNVDDRVVEQKRKTNKAKHRVDICKADVDAMEHKKRALEKLVDLWRDDYWSTPRETQNNQGKKSMGDYETRSTRDRIRRKLNKRDDED